MDQCGRLLEAGEVMIQLENNTSISPKRLKYTITIQESMIIDRDGRLLRPDESCLQKDTHVIQESACSALRSASAL